MHKTLLVALTALGLFASGCAGIKIVRMDSPEPAAGPPKIGQVLDLGALPLALTGELSAAHHDGRITPGEWLAVLGDNLGPAKSLNLAGVDLPVLGHLQGGLLTRAPRALSPFSAHVLTVSTPQGQATKDIRLSRHLVAADSDGKRVRFLPLGPEPTLEQEPSSLELPGAWAHTLSPTGGLAYFIQYPAATTDPKTGQSHYDSQIMVVHLGAKDSPAKLTSFRVKLVSAPSAMAMPDERSLLVLAETELVLMDVSDPKSSKELSRLELAPRTQAGQNAARPTVHTELEICGPGRVALLEVYSNGLSLIDFSDRNQLKLVSSFALAGDAELPLTIDVARDPDDPNTLWILQGPNFRVAGIKIRAGMGWLENKIDGLWAKVTAEQAPGPAPKMPSGQVSVSRLVKVQVKSDGFAITASRILPAGFYPLFVHSLPGGEQLISGVGSRVFDFVGIDASLKGVKQAIAVIKGSAQLGKILHLKPDGQMSSRYQGTALYFNLNALPDGKLITTVLRPGVNGFPPSASADWGVEVEGIGFALFRQLGYRSLLPPYSVGLIGLQ